MYRRKRAPSCQNILILILCAGMCLLAASAHTSTPPPAALQCSYCIYPTGRSYSSDIAIGSVAVTAPDGCDWTATSNDGFIAVTSGATGTGRGVVTYSVASNAGNAARTGTITIAGQTFTVTQERACAPRPAGLAGWWPAERNPNDLLGANHGSLQGGVTFSPGKVGSAFSFDGVNDAFQTPPTAILNSLPLTIEAWVNPSVRDDGTDFPANVASNDRPGFGGHGFGVNVFTSGSQMKVEYQQGERVVPGVLFTAGQWYHVAVVYTTGNLKVYVDGQQVDDFSYGQGALDGDNIIRIGFHNNDAGTGSRRFFKGLIDEASVYSRALSASEVQNIFDADSAGKCREIDFVDVLPSHPFYTHIRRLSALGITLGCTTTNFCPDDVVTRQQMAAFIIRALGIVNPPQP
ncbi:MAG TPA: LamG-like jellyroll fold domain-containing protein, partial [Blastocatellia bacterium]|nr:LamG-like jellyroll fold domain-containing protein [Blastocatellia bacterium]